MVWKKIHIFAGVNKTDTDMERTFIFTYYHPLRYKGTYVAKGKDSFEASNRVKNYLIEKFGDTKHSYCVVSEVEENKLIYV